MVLFTWRWQPHFRFLKQLVDDGYIGRCYQAQFSFVGGFGRNQDYRWRYDSQRSNGIVSDLGAHMIDFARWYIGDIRKVSASLGTFVERNGINRKPLDPANDAAFVMLQFGNGAQAVVQASAVAHRADRGFEIRVQLQGDKGTLEVDHVFSGPDASVTIRGARDKDERFGRLSIPDTFLKDLDGVDNLAPYFKQSAGPRLFVDAIAEDLSIVPNFYDGLKVQEVIDAAIESHRTECAVSLL
jgi:predicted dehydrogenase